MYFMNMNMLDKGELNRRFDAVLDVMKNPLKSHGSSSSDVRTALVIAERIHDYIDYVKTYKGMESFLQESAEYLKHFYDLEAIAVSDLDKIFQDIRRRVEQDGFASSTMTDIFTDFNHYKTGDINGGQWQASPIGDGWENKKPFEFMLTCIINICRELVRSGKQQLVEDFLQFKNKEAKIREEGYLAIPNSYSNVESELKRFRSSELGKRYRAWQLLEDVNEQVNIGHSMLDLFPQYYLHQADIYKLHLETVHNLLLLDGTSSQKNEQQGSFQLIYNQEKSEVGISSEDELKWRMKTQKGKMKEASVALRTLFSQPGKVCLVKQDNIKNAIRSLSKALGKPEKKMEDAFIQHQIGRWSINQNYLKVL